MKETKKAVILVAGFGTRFLPATLGTPKPMFAVVDKPILFYLLKECADSGITDVCLVSKKDNKAIKDFVYPNKKLIEKLKHDGKMDFLKEYYEVMNKLKISFVCQKAQNGTAGAVLCAKKWVGNDNFVLFYGDDLIESDTPMAKQLIETYNQTGKSVCLLNEVPKEDIHRYGSAIVENVKGKDYLNLYGIVEKPKTEEAPSLYSMLGRFLLTNEIFDAMKNLPVHNGEYYLTDAITILAKNERFNAILCNGYYHDCGNKFEFMKTITQYAIKNKDFGNNYSQFIKDLAKKL